jgi:hypothetical protein
MDNWPLSWFEVSCDGSACGSPGCGRHVHPPQHSLFLGPAIGVRVTVRDGERVSYAKAEGITRLLMLEGS